MSKPITLVILLGCWSLSGCLKQCGGDGTGNIKMSSGLMIQDIKKGEGPTAEIGKKITVHYTGWLEDGKKFGSSQDRNTPFPFTLGAGQVIKGWDQGVAGMNVGGVRKLTIPADLAYGERGAGNIIPPNATLIFEVELLSVE